MNGAGFVLFLMLAAGPSSLQAQVSVTQPALADPSQTRQGLWGNGGLGYGSASCGTGWMGGPGGSLAVGGTLSRKILLGAGISGWSRSEGRLTLQLASLDAQARFYPDPLFRFFFIGGLGLGTVRLSDGQNGASLSSTGVSGLLGAGYDIRIAGNVSLTPFATASAMRAGRVHYDVVQTGLGVTVH